MKGKTGPSVKSRTIVESTVALRKKNAVRYKTSVLGRAGAQEQDKQRKGLLYEKLSNYK